MRRRLFPGLGSLARGRLLRAARRSGCACCDRTCSPCSTGGRRREAVGCHRCWHVAGWSPRRHRPGCSPETPTRWRGTGEPWTTQTATSRSFGASAGTCRQRPAAAEACTEDCGRAARRPLGAPGRTSASTRETRRSRTASTSWRATSARPTAASARRSRRCRLCWIAHSTASAYTRSPASATSGSSTWAPSRGRRGAGRRA
mmetsp:Transcript_25081/g.63338  ORF Transcript_25081/g.63338 Transcript_25081/m.63338 type:complete len:202 (+) Transcript_25081:2-607(+)